MISTPFIQGGGGDIALAGISDMSAFARLMNTDTTDALVRARIGAAATAHIHIIGDTTGLQAALDGKALASHAHVAADITSGTIATARLGTGTANNTTFLRGDSTYVAVAAPWGQHIRKAATETVASSIVLQDDNDFIGILLPSVGKYAVDLKLALSANASGGFQAQLAGPTISSWSADTLSAAVADGAPTIFNTIVAYTTFSVFVANTAAFTSLSARFIIVVTDVTTALKLQWAQNASFATGTQVKIGSTMTVTRISD